MDKGWKKVERRLARDVGVNRIPVTGERHGADFEDGIACYQVKCRKAIPGWLWDWLCSIQGNAKPKGKAGVLVLKKPRQKDAEGLVVLSWADWVDLHGPADKRIGRCHHCDEQGPDRKCWWCGRPGTGYISAGSGR